MSQGKKKETAESSSFGGCACGGCKASASRFSFCDEHYEQFKFGLIKKSGDPVSDFEKKFEHYQSYRKRLKTPKVA